MQSNTKWNEETKTVVVTPRSVWWDKDETMADYHAHGMCGGWKAGCALCCATEGATIIREAPVATPVLIEM